MCLCVRRRWKWKYNACLAQYIREDKEFGRGSEDSVAEESIGIVCMCVYQVRFKKYGLANLFCITKKNCFLLALGLLRYLGDFPTILVDEIYWKGSDQSSPPSRTFSLNLFLQSHRIYLLSCHSKFKLMCIPCIRSDEVLLVIL